MKRRPWAGDVPPEIKAESSNATRRRMRALRRYITELTVKPADALDIVGAVAFDLNEVITAYRGDLNAACGDSRMTHDAEKRRSDAKERF